MKTSKIKMFFLILASASTSIRAELPDTYNSPSRNPCSHSDLTCLRYYSNSGSDEKSITMTIVDGLTAEEIGDIDTLSISLALCKEYKIKEKIWKLNKEQNDKGVISVGLELPEKYEGLTFDHSNLTYGKSLATELVIDFEPLVDDGQLYYSLKFKETNVPISFEASYSGMLDENKKRCQSASLKIDF